MRAQSADGVVHDFPDDTDPAVMDRVMKNYADNVMQKDAAGEARQVAARRVRRPTSMNAPQYDDTAPTSTWEDVGGTVQRVPPAFNKALGSTAGRAADTVISWAQPGGGALTKPVHPVEDLITNSKVPDSVPVIGGGHTVPDYGPPQTWSQSVADAGGKMLGETAPYMVGGAGLFPKVVKPALDAAPSVANAFRSAAHNMGQMMVRKPVGSIAGETGAAVESGAGGEALRQTSPDDEPGMQHLKESTGQLITPTALQATLTALAMRAGKYGVPLIHKGTTAAVKGVSGLVPEDVRPAWLDRMAKQAEEERMNAARGDVGKKLEGALATPEAQAGLAETEELKKRVPGFNPGVARATGDRELLNTQQKLDTEATGDKLREKRGVFDASQKAIKDKYENAVPAVDTEHPADTVAAAATRRVEGTQQRIENQAENVRGDIQRRSDSLPEVDRIGAGNALRESREAAQRATDMETTRLRQAIAHPEQPLQVGEEATTVGAALDRRTEINQQIRDITGATARSPNDNRALRELQAERDSIDSAIDSHTGDESLTAYTQHYRTENVPNFRQGASKEVGQRDASGYGGNRVDPEKVAGKFFNPNEESAAAQFDRSMAHDPGARQNMVDSALDDLRRTYIDPNTGQLRPGSVEKWLQKNSRVLNAMPETGAEIRAAIQTRNPDQLYDRLGRLEGRQRSVADTKLAKGVRSTQAPGKTSEDLIAPALKDHTLMQQVMNSVRGDAAGEAAARRAVFDVMRKQAPDAIDKPEAFLGWLKDHDRSLRVALTPEHRADLEAVAKAAMIQSRGARPAGTVEVPKGILGTIEDLFGITVGSAASTGRAVAQGRTSPVIEGVSQGAKFLKRQTSKASQAAWEEALSNPEAAKVMANAARSGKATKQQVTKLRSYIVGAGASKLNGTEED